MSDPIKIEGDVGEQLSAILDRLENPGPMLETLGRLGQQSVRTTFARGGRPDKWPAPKHRDGQRGRDTGRLMGSFTRGAAGEVFELGKYSIAFGTIVDYAGTQNFGAKKGEYGTHTVTVPAHSVSSYEVPAHSVLPHTRKNPKGEMDTVYVRGYTVAAHSVLPHTQSTYTKQQEVPWGDIPALNFLTLHPEDVEDFAEIVDDWIMEGNDG
jgi:phage gpG-like protein